jgi:thiol:disulfide interchange protein DsbD
MLKRYGLYGPPGILFFDAQGKELEDFRVVGYQDAAQFLKTLQQVGL